MRDLLILNDLHLGTQRSAGTTPLTAAALKLFLFGQLADILTAHPDKDLLINGDLFDKFSEDESTIEMTFKLLVSWLRTSGGILHLVPGNHDFSAKADKLSSFHLLAGILADAFPSQVRVYFPELRCVRDGLWVIPHCLNQDLFDMELEKAIAGAHGKLLLHANCMNPFAEQSDHSLNVNEEMARRLTDAGIQLIFAHEHQRRCITFKSEGFKQSSDWNHDADIIVLGNQFPSSVADCLAHGSAQKDGLKFAHVINEEGKISQIETWQAEGNFIEVDWQELGTATTEQFIRVTGAAEQAQAADVVCTIAKYRSKSPALIITNAVKIAGITSSEDFDGVSLETIKAFDVRTSLLELFEPAERKVLEAILED